MDSCPKELKPFEKAHQMKIKEQDSLQHLWLGSYGISAFMFAINHCFSDNPTFKYTDDLVLQDLGMTKEEIEQRELNKFLLQNEKMRNEWKNKNKGR